MGGDICGKIGNMEHELNPVFEGKRLLCEQRETRVLPREASIKISVKSLTQSYRPAK